MSISTHIIEHIPIVSEATVKATTIYSDSYKAHFAMDPSLSLTAGWSGNQWLSISGTNSNQKFNFDTGGAINTAGVTIVNSHSNGSSITSGVRNIIIYGTDDITAFENLEYINVDNLTEIMPIEVPQYSTLYYTYGVTYNFRYYIFPAPVSFRYFVLRIANNWGNSSYMGIRAIYPVVLRDVPLTITPSIGFTNFYGHYDIHPYPYHHKRNVLGGVVHVNGVPAKKRVVIFEKKTHLPVMSTFSDAVTGEWKIANVMEYPLKSLYAIVFDDTGEFNAEIYDHVSQVITPIE